MAGDDVPNDEEGFFLLESLSESGSKQVASGPSDICNRDLGLSIWHLLALLEVDSLW